MQSNETPEDLISSLTIGNRIAKLICKALWDQFGLRPLVLLALRDIRGSSLATYYEESCSGDTWALVQSLELDPARSEPNDISLTGTSCNSPKLGNTRN